MNRIYRLIFNRKLGVMQVASELATSTSTAGRAGTATPLLRRSKLAYALAMMVTGAAMSTSSSADAQVMYKYYTDNETISDSSSGVWDNAVVHIGRNEGDDVTVRVQGNGQLSAVTHDSSIIYGYLRIGSNKDTRATVTVDGPNAGVYGQRTIEVGTYNTGISYSSTGILNIQNGALASTVHEDASRNIPHGDVYITPGGTVNVKDAGSRLLTGFLQVGGGVGGRSTGGNLFVTDGGAVLSDSASVYALFEQDAPTMVVSGQGSHWTNTGAMTVGGLDITDGATVTTGSARVVGQPTQHGAGIFIGGAGSSFTSSGTIAIADGLVTVSDGGTLASGNNSITLGTDATLWNSGMPGGLAIGGRVSWTDSAFPKPVAAAPTAAGSVNPDAVITFLDESALNNTAVIFNHTERDYRFANKLVSNKPGDGAVYSLAGTTTLEGDLSAFSGAVRVLGGKLTLASDIGDTAATSKGSYMVYSGGQLNVDSVVNLRDFILSANGDYLQSGNAAGGTLSGRGTLNLRNLFAYDGARIAPGDGGIGMLTVNGNVLIGTSESGGIGTDRTTGEAPATTYFDVDVAADGTSDKLVVNGKASISADAYGHASGAPTTVQVSALDPNTSYQNGQTYTILSATGGVTGQFTGVASDSAFLAPTLRYDANNVFLTVGLNVQNIGSGQVLSGNQDQVTTNLLAGGTLSPGTADARIGAVQFNGDLSFAAGAFYDVDIKGTAPAATGASIRPAAVSTVNDVVNVSGKTTLDGGTVRVTALDPQTSYQEGHAYTIVHADGGVSGTFAGSSSSSAFLATSLSYTANDVVLGIRLTPAGGGVPGTPGTPGTPGSNLPPPIFETVAQSRNQFNTALALDTLPQEGQALALYNTLLQLNAQDARHAFGSLSGEVHAAARSALLEDRFLRDGVTQRLSGQVAAMRDGGLGVWVAGSGASGHLDGDDNGARMETQRQGLMAGADWTLGEATVIGLVAGNEDIQQRLPQWQSKAEVDATEVGLYAATRLGALSLRGGVNYADYEVETARQAVVGASVSQAVGARYDAQALTAYAEGGWDFTWDTLTLTPYLAVAHTRLETDGATEAGGSTALVVAGSKDDVLTATLGARAAWDISGGQIDGAVLTAGLAWQNASGELKADSRARFAAGGDSFTVYGTPLARNVAVAELGVGVNTGEHSRLSLAAQGRAGDGQREVGAQLNWAWTF
ncbi:MAG: autotransporter domain-containing protein [Pseudoxanthomonas sp.]